MAAPVVTSVAAPANTTYLLGQTLGFSVNFDQAVTVAGGVPTLAVALNTGGAVQATYISGSGTTSLTFNYTVIAGQADPDGVTVGGSVSLNGATIQNVGLEDAVTTLNGVGSTAGVLVDGIVPAVTSVSVPANGAYHTGDQLDFTVNFGENVTVNTGGGTPSVALTLDTGGAVQASYISGTGTGALVFRYTVQAGNLDANGITVGALSANGGTLRDAGGNDANLTLNSVGATTAVLVDAVAPTVTSVSVPSNATYTVGQQLDFTVNYDEAVTVNTGGGTPRIAVTLDTGGVVNAAYVSGSGTSALLFRYTVASGNADANGIAVGATVVPNGGALRDAAGNDAVATLNSVGATTSVLVNGIASHSITALSAVKAEGDAGSTAYTFTVTRTNDTTGATAVNYAVTGSGGSPADAADFGGALPSGVVNFGAADVTQTITVNVSGDTVAEPENGFTVTLTSSGGSVIGTATALGSITDDDTPAPAPPPEPGVGTSGADTLDGGSSGDTIAPSGGNDNVRGLDGNDSVSGGEGADTVNGNKGADSVSGGDGSDVAYGGQGNDSVDGGGGDDSHVNGNLGNDTVNGGDGADTVYGGQGSDSVYGGAGDDRVSGDLGNDHLFGGAGADRFAFAVGGGQDWVGDFNAAEGSASCCPPARPIRSPPSRARPSSTLAEAPRSGWPASPRSTRPG
jgi:Ca2+-binding RTX toxin-like protein